METESSERLNKAAWEAETATYLAQFAANTVALVVADLDRRELINTELVNHIQDQLLELRDRAPDRMQDIFAGLGDMLDGLHYRTGAGGG